MREIKFRAWDASKKLMITPTMLSPRFLSLDGKSMYIESERMQCFGGGYDLKPQKFDCLMQYTGLKDKNGKEIYQDDVVRVVRNSGEFDETAYVIFYDGAFRLNGIYILESDLLGQLKPELLEVIGNVYENKELIEAL